MQLFPFFAEKNFLIPMEFRTLKVLRKVLLELFHENYAIKVSYSAKVKGISVKASLLGAKW